MERVLLPAGEVFSYAGVRPPGMWRLRPEVPAKSSVGKVRAWGALCWLCSCQSLGFEFSLPNTRLSHWGCCRFGEFKVMGGTLLLGSNRWAIFANLTELLSAQFG